MFTFTLATQGKTKLHISFLCPSPFFHIFQHAHLLVNMFTKTDFSILSFHFSIECITLKYVITEKILQTVTFVIHIIISYLSFTHVGIYVSEKTCIADILYKIPYQRSLLEGSEDLDSPEVPSKLLLADKETFFLLFFC